MSHRVLPVLLLLALLLCAGDAARGQQKPKDLEWSHAFDLAARKPGENDFSDKTQKFGVEVFRDDNNLLGVYISEKGGLAVTTAVSGAAKLPIGSAKGPEWLTGLDIPTRRAGQKEFTKDTKVYSLEVFRDPNVDAWLYVTAEKANLAAMPVKTKPAGGSKAPKWVHSFDLSCRKGGTKSWDGALKYGIEVYQDGNTGNLLYICGETGSIAIGPESVEIKGEGKAPEWLHGLDLGCRKPDEKSFGPDTRKLGVEVYRDITTSNLVFLTETGAIAVTPAPKDLKAPTANVKEPAWSHGLNVKCRSFGEKEFSEKTRVFGIEVFRDDNLSAIIYVNNEGNISAVAK